jgi:hypothetical protein
MSSRVPVASETVVPFVTQEKTAVPDNADLLDRAGQTILGLLNRAAGMAEETSQQALEVARKLSLDLRAAEERIRDLEADVRHHQDRAERAEKWLYQISVEIEQRFFAKADSPRAHAPARQTSAQDYAPRNGQRRAQS